MAYCILNELSHPENTESVREAKIALLKMHSAALPLILVGLQDNRWRVRLRVTEFLGETSFYSRAVVPQLCRLLRDSKARIRRMALVCLARAGQLDAQTIDYVAFCLKDRDDEVRGLAVHCLAKYGKHPKLVGLILSCLNDKIPKVRGAAALALGEIRNAEVTDELFVSLMIDDEARPQIIEALARICPSRLCRALLAESNLLDVVRTRTPEPNSPFMGIARTGAPELLPVLMKHQQKFEALHALCCLDPVDPELLRNLDFRPSFWAANAVRAMYIKSFRGKATSATSELEKAAGFARLCLHEWTCENNNKHPAQATMALENLVHQDSLANREQLATFADYDVSLWSSEKSVAAAMGIKSAALAIAAPCEETLNTYRARSEGLRAKLGCCAHGKALAAAFKDHPWVHPIEFS